MGSAKRPASPGNRRGLEAPQSGDALLGEVHVVELHRLVDRLVLVAEILGRDPVEAMHTLMEVALGVDRFEQGLSLFLDGIERRIESGWDG